ncbi:MAG: bile acid:sodium symporter family protein [Oleispira antarctica]|uniref:Bile acid:sodium symporter n=1 Tax=Oleispira antarctica RB-8 TaxID=698738 RepID=R4YTJ8_OLEAN|nr:bile acid:sodium symporter family protein [Oleispira antarctica]MBQ0791710.1 bile acid:sodium symporter family protein [Oleispira antarctica]CCK77058.1 Bile acid:sodium symporter [Oleispira antarctica RB-8]
MFQTLTQVALPIAIILIMTGVGLSLVPTDFKRVFQQPKAFLVGATCQMLLLPLIAIAVIALTGLEGELAIGLFILSLCPGGATSNLYSYLAKADVSLSVSLTSVIGFITPFTIPLLAAWAINFYGIEGEQFELPIISTWIKLMAVTVIPVLIGMGIRAKWSNLAKRSETYVSGFSMAVLAFIIISICINLGEKLIDFAIATGPAVIILNLTTMTLGYFAGRFLLHQEAQSRTITIEVGLQNGTLALLITSGILESSAMSIAPSIYSVFMFMTASLFTYCVLRKDNLVKKS